MKKRRTATGLISLASGVALLALQACQDETSPASREAPFEISGVVRATHLDEISGIEAGLSSEWIVHNDDGAAEVHLIDAVGNFLTTIKIQGAKNRDWEDLTTLPGDDGPLLVIADSGDNLQVRGDITLYFVPLPVMDASGNYPKALKLIHKVKLRYPDGARDCESLAFDPVSGSLLLLSKRDTPPRLYGIDAKAALQQKEMQLEFLGEVPKLRPPSPSDLLRDPDRGAWYSQPTGMAISGDGNTAAVITYRSLYLFRRQAGQSWAEALAGQPQEFVGPPGRSDEAVTFRMDQDSAVVISEGVPATLYELGYDRP